MNINGGGIRIRIRVHGLRFVILLFTTLQNTAVISLAVILSKQGDLGTKTTNCGQIAIDAAIILRRFTSEITQVLYETKVQVMLN